MNIKILITAHKSYWMIEDEMYLPLRVGCNRKIDFTVS